MKTLRPLVLSAALSAALAVAAAAGAAYPEKAIRVLVPAAAENGSDVQMRLVADQAAKQLGQTIVVENRPGAGGTIAAREAARAAPDGYLILMGTNASQLTSPLLYKDAGYDPEKSFVPIVRFSRSPMVMLVPSSLGVSELNAFLKLARERKDPLNYASGGAGTLMHLSGEFLQREAQVRMVHVPYKGASPGLVDLMGGRVAAMFVPIHNALGLSDRSLVRILFVADDKRLPAIPDVPTAAELGFRNLLLVSWSGLFAPAGVPPANAARLADEFMRALENPAVIEAIRRRGGDTEPQRREAFTEFMRSELARYRSLLRDMKVEAN